jgi:hypothetical protein
VLGETDGNWASARFTFNQSGYTIPGIEDDLSIPTSPDAPWSTSWGSTRAQRSWSDQPDGAADLGVEVVGVCEDCVDSEINVYVSVSNLGAVFAPDGLTVSVYAVDGSTRTRITSTATTEPIYPGDRKAPLRFTIPVASVGTDGLYVKVDDDDDVRECDESNNTDTWDALTCPS